MKRINVLAWTALTVLFFFATSCRKDLSSTATGKTAPRAVTSFKVIGYLPSWSGSVPSIPFSKLTHINYAFALPNSNGTYQAIDNTSKLSSMVSSAHAAGVKALLSVGGGGGGGEQHDQPLQPVWVGRDRYRLGIPESGDPGESVPDDDDGVIGGAS